MATGYDVRTFVSQRRAFHYADGWAESEGGPVGVYQHARLRHYLVTDVDPDSVQQAYSAAWGLVADFIKAEPDSDDWDAEDEADHADHGHRDLGDER